MLEKLYSIASSAIIGPQMINQCEETAHADQLWAVQDEVTVAGRPWHVLQTKSRQEKALAETLSARGMQYFLPLVQVNRVYGGRRAKVELPLFPGYLFLRGSLDDVYTADRTKRVARVVPVFDQAKLNEELVSLRLALEHADQEVSFDPFPYLKRGIRVVITSGPMRGVRGVIEDRRRRDRLILQVNVLGQATSLEVDSALLEPIGEN